MFEEVEIDFPKERPHAVVFHLRHRLGERDSLNLLTRIRQLKKQDYSTFVLDLSKAKGVTGAGLGALSYLAHESSTPFPLVVQNPEFSKLFKLAKLENKVVIAASLQELWGKIEEKST